LAKAKKNEIDNELKEVKPLSEVFCCTPGMLKGKSTEGNTKND
jgi:hypothetical protein